MNLLSLWVGEPEVHGKVTKLQSLTELVVGAELVLRVLLCTVTRETEHGRRTVQAELPTAVRLLGADRVRAGGHARVRPCAIGDLLGSVCLG